jgi:hypothetical protein
MNRIVGQRLAVSVGYGQTGQALGVVQPNRQIRRSWRQRDGVDISNQLA